MYFRFHHLSLLSIFSLHACYPTSITFYLVLHYKHKVEFLLSLQLNLNLCSLNSPSPVIPINVEHWVRAFRVRYKFSEGNRWERMRTGGGVVGITPSLYHRTPSRRSNSAFGNVVVCWSSVSDPWVYFSFNMDWF